MLIVTNTIDKTTLVPRSLSPRNIYERNTPNKGIVNLYILTLPTPLYLRRIVHRENAAAEIKANYNSQL